MQSKNASSKSTPGAAPAERKKTKDKVKSKKKSDKTKKDRILNKKAEPPKLNKFRTIDAIVKEFLTSRVSATNVEEITSSREHLHSQLAAFFAPHALWKPFAAEGELLQDAGQLLRFFINTVNNQARLPGAPEYLRTISEKWKTQLKAPRKIFLEKKHKRPSDASADKPDDGSSQPKKRKKTKSAASADASSQPKQKKATSTEAAPQPTDTQKKQKKQKDAKVSASTAASPQPEKAQPNTQKKQKKQKKQEAPVSASTGASPQPEKAPKTPTSASADASPSLQKKQEKQKTQKTQDKQQEATSSAGLDASPQPKKKQKQKEAKGSPSTGSAASIPSSKAAGKPKKAGRPDKQ
eukprot:TRINITY_DN9968_c0_g1_i1.p1 TRINITY_DN9968_c0_g1~~TRINITY_DN9968_c0_g1_i1.p1  ORF type:complete len:398 (-),score=109.28 TRINITY_DN9968_c0_g1_i1:67-1122(-)